MLITAAIMAGVIIAIGYLCLVFKIGFMVGDATEHTGFDVGFYMITICSLLALPFAIGIGIYNS